MSKPLVKPSFPSEYTSEKRKLETLERSFILGGNLFEVNTSGLSNKEIDEIVVGGRGNPENGRMISDSVNKLLLVRQEGVWRRVGVE
jgi:hypothetical protein